MMPLRISPAAPFAAAASRCGLLSCRPPTHHDSRRSQRSTYYSSAYSASNSAVLVLAWHGSSYMMLLILRIVCLLLGAAHLLVLASQLAPSALQFTGSSNACSINAAATLQSTRHVIRGLWPPTGAACPNVLSSPGHYSVVGPRFHRAITQLRVSRACASITSRPSALLLSGSSDACRDASCKATCQPSASAALLIGSCGPHICSFQHDQSPLATCLLGQQPCMRGVHPQVPA